jgi:hypothetical protein
MSVNASRQFVESFHGGDARAAIREIARTHGIAVAMQDRGDFEQSLGREMDEDEFEDLKECLDGFQEFLANSGAAESLDAWRYQVLDKFGFLDEQDDDGSVEEPVEQG